MSVEQFLVVMRMIYVSISVGKPRYEVKLAFFYVTTSGSGTQNDGLPNGMPLRTHICGMNGVPGIP